jgi:imidazolonepropionase-like amidohydrolase
MAVITTFLMPISVTSMSLADNVREPHRIVINNVNIFDGKTDELAMNMNVLIENNLIKKIAKNSIAVVDDAIVINGNGRTLMPGLIDMHSHLAIAAKSLVEFENTPWDALGARTAATAEDALMDGCSTTNRWC